MLIRCEDFVHVLDRLLQESRSGMDWTALAGTRFSSSVGKYPRRAPFAGQSHEKARSSAARGRRIFYLWVERFARLRTRKRRSALSRGVWLCASLVPRDQSDPFMQSQVHRFATANSEPETGSQKPSCLGTCWTAS